MSLLSQPLATGRLVGTIYTFENIGDILPMHRHGPNDVHITIVARGCVRVHGPIIGDHLFYEGAVLDAESDVEHEFIGMTANSRIVNIIKDPIDGAAPPTYK